MLTAFFLKGWYGYLLRCCFLLISRFWWSFQHWSTLDHWFDFCVECWRSVSWWNKRHGRFLSDFINEIVFEVKEIKRNAQKKQNWRWFIYSVSFFIGLLLCHSPENSSIFRSNLSLWFWFVFFSVLFFVKISIRGRDLDYKTRPTSCEEDLWNAQCRGRRFYSGRWS